MATLLTYGLAAAGLGLVGWLLVSPKKAYVPPGVKPGTPISGVFVDRATARDDWDAGVLDGAVRGYDAGKVAAAGSDFRPELETLSKPAGVASFPAYASGYPCGAQTGFRLGQRMQKMVGAAAAAGTSVDKENPTARKSLTDGCAAGFDAWFKIHGAEPVPATAVAGAASPHLQSAQSSPTLWTAWGRTPITLAAPRRV